MWNLSLYIQPFPIVRMNTWLFLLQYFLVLLKIQMTIINYEALFLIDVKVDYYVGNGSARAILVEPG